MRVLASTRGLRLVLALLALALLYVAMVQVGTRLLGGWQIDLTRDHIYTLAPGTRAIARSPREPVQLTLYFSRHAARDLPQLRAYARRVQTLLREVARVSQGRVRLALVDPRPYSEAEDRALAAGLSALPVGPEGQRVIFGLVGTNATTGIADIPFLQPDKEAFLEYDVARLIHELVTQQRPLVGLISGLPVEGTPGSANTPGLPPWTAFQQLGQLFRVQPLDGRTLTAIPAAVRVLLLVQPDMLSAGAVQAIRAFLLRGGHLALFIDPDPETLPPARAMASAQASWRALQPLFAEWGVSFDPDRVVLDPTLARSVALQPGMVPAPDPAVLGLGRDELSHDDVITAGLRSINVSTIGSFEQTEHARLRLVPLLQSSGDAGSASVQRVLDTPDPQALLDNLRQARGRYVLAARLTGALAPGAQQADIVLVADTDLLSDRLWVQLLPFFGQTLTSPFANNGDFFLNVVDNLSGSSALISIRGRAVASRPFTRLRALRAEAEQAFRERRLALQQQLDAAEQRLLEIEQARRAAGASISLHEAEYRAASEQQREIRSELRRIERDLDARILRLQWRIETLDIFLLPALIALFGLLLAAWRRWRGNTAT
ncbi:Gldg family protein [Metallibacterium sp.]|uniref:Gldg family protein n=1 Tax=Metallibacterium sp. TaxID=2940281 RepID=UPI002610AE70|nr:Gldg family protein [Metallibacterium sp.]